MLRITKFTGPVTEHIWGQPRPKPQPGERQVIFEDGVPRMVNFLCPCGCGYEVPTHVSVEGEPKQLHRWQYMMFNHWIYPSVRWLSGCKAHFNILADGTVVWHADSGK